MKVLFHGVRYNELGRQLFINRVSMKVELLSLHELIYCEQYSLLSTIVHNLKECMSIVLDCL